MTPEDIQKMLESISKSGINVKGDLVLEKHVEHEVNNVEPGGIGIQINNGEIVKKSEEVIADAVDENQENEDEQGDEEGLNYFQPTKRLQLFLNEEWFKELRTEEKYNKEWTDAFVEALMETEWKDGIDQEWAIQGKREKKNQVKGWVVGLLSDAGVLKGAYDNIAAKIELSIESRTFSRYMSDGKQQPFAQWVKDYVNGH